MCKKEVKKCFLLSNSPEEDAPKISVPTPERRLSCLLRKAGLFELVRNSHNPLQA